MKNFIKKSILSTLTVGLMSVGSAFAEWKPKKPITLEIGFEPGGPIGATTQAIANAIEKQRGWKVVLKHKHGGGGIAMLIGLSKRPADNHTIGFGVNLPLLIAMQTKGKKLPINIDSFKYVGTASKAALAIMVPPNSPYKTFREFVEASKTKRLRLGASSPGTMIMSRAIKNSEGAGYDIISQKGVETMKSIVGGHIDAGWSGGMHVRLMRAGKVKVIGAMTKDRQEAIPNVPTGKEMGMKYINFDIFFFVAMNKNTSPEALKAIRKAWDDALKDPNVIKVTEAAFGSNPFNFGAKTKSIFKQDKGSVKDLLKRASDKK